MAKSVDKFGDKLEEVFNAGSEYKPPLREALVKAMQSDGMYIGICRFCKQKIRATSLAELMKHKCDGQTNIQTDK